PPARRWALPSGTPARARTGVPAWDAHARDGRRPRAVRPSRGSAPYETPTQWTNAAPSGARVRLRAVVDSGCALPPVDGAASVRVLQDESCFGICVFGTSHNRGASTHYEQHFRSCVRNASCILTG